MKEQQLTEDEYLTTSELAAILGISRIAVYKRIKKGEIKAIKIGNIYAIPKSYITEISGRSISAETKEEIEKAVHKTMKEYGEVIIRLGEE